MQRSYPAPAPVSVSRRMRERIRKGNRDLQGWIEKAKATINDTKMGKRAKAEILRSLDLALRDADAHGAFAAQQAMEEVSSVAESMMTVMADKAALAGTDPGGLLVGGNVPTPRLLTDGTDADD